MNFTRNDTIKGCSLISLRAIMRYYQSSIQMATKRVHVSSVIKLRFRLLAEKALNSLQRARIVQSVACLALTT